MIQDGPIAIIPVQSAGAAVELANRESPERTPLGGRGVVYGAIN